jgi:hypothetical protein
MEFVNESQSPQELQDLRQGIKRGLLFEFLTPQTDKSIGRRTCAGFSLSAMIDVKKSWS